MVVKSFVSRQIQPLAQRVNYGFEYLGAKDPSKISSEELSSRKVLALMKELLKGIDSLLEDVMPTFSTTLLHPQVKILKRIIV